MRDFLTFLNTASLDELAEAPGITRTLAGNMIEARPFDFVEDCLQVHGMGKNLLARLQDYVARLDDDSENHELLPSEEAEALPAVVQKPPTQKPPHADEPSFGVRLWRAFLNFMRALIRLILLVALIVVIGVALYYGLPYINARFVAPVEKNTSNIATLKAEISQLQVQVDETNSKISTLQRTVDTQTASIDKLDAMQRQIEEELQGNQDKALLQLKQEVMLTRALDILGRARVYLAQSNFGMAKTDVQSARDLLAELQAETQDDYLTQAISRLDLALENLPDFPIVASGDVEIAWDILVTGDATQNGAATFTPTPTPFGTFTPTPFATPISETPTPLP